MDLPNTTHQLLPQPHGSQREKHSNCSHTQIQPLGKAFYNREWLSRKEGLWVMWDGELGDWRRSVKRQSWNKTTRTRCPFEK